MHLAFITAFDEYPQAFIGEMRCLFIQMTNTPVLKLGVIFGSCGWKCKQIRRCFRSTMAGAACTRPCGWITANLTQCSSSFISRQIYCLLNAFKCSDWRSVYDVILIN